MKIVEIGHCTLIHADCMDVMRDMPDKAFDLAIVDPPYGINVNSMNMGSRQTIRPDKRKWDDKIPAPNYFYELSRVSLHYICWGGNYFPSIWPGRCFIIWDKGESMYGRSFAECELALTNFDKSARIFKFNPNDSSRIHPTQKPIALYSWLLTNYAKPGQTILDTHLGSGSSAIAANKLGFKFTGIELDEDYFNAACERIAQHHKQTSLFDSL